MTTGVEAADGVGSSLVQQAGNALLRTFDKALDAEWRRAQDYVAGLRRRHPEASVGDLATRIRQDFCRDLAALGGTAGAVSAVPGAGTAVRVAAGLSGEGLILLERSVRMVLAMAHVHGHELGELEIRKYALLRVLGTWAGATEGMVPFTTLVATGLGRRATEAIPMTAVHAVNKAVGKRVLVKWGSKTGAVRLGSVLPVGIGIVLGAGGNYAMGRGLARAAVAEFS